MKQEDKELLFKDLSGRLPYGVKLKNTRKVESDIGYIVKLYSINLDEYYCKIAFYTYEGKALCVSNEDNLFKVGNMDVNFLRYIPCLFPLSSMTEEQKEELKQRGWYFDCFEIYNVDKHGYREAISHEDCFDLIDWLNKNHFDYRGLIPKSLAIDCTNLNIY